MAQERTASSNGERAPRDEFEVLRSDLDTLRQDFGTLVSTLKENVSGRGRALARDLQTAGQHQLRTAERKIEERPLMSVAIAFVTGLIVGRLLDRD